MKRTRSKLKLRKDDRDVVYIRMDPKLHRFLKAAAATRGLSLSEFMIAKVLGGEGVIVHEDFIPAPAPVAPAAPPVATPAPESKK